MAVRTQDDGARGEYGLCISVRRTGNVIELTFDDVIRKDATPYRVLWQQEAFITFAELTKDEVEGGLSEERLAQFGRFVWGMLGRSLLR